MLKDMKYCIFSVEDVFRNLKSTENYIEKYLPFKIQNFITDSLYFCLGKKELYKLQEHDTRLYNKLQDIILSDDGKPALNKTSYRIPKYKPIVLDSENVENQEMASGSKVGSRG
jgi:hypothetical protein